MPTTRTDRLKEAHDRLTEAVESITTGDDWQRMLKVASKFHRYSFNNQLMISLQQPDATHVAGFTRWKSLGRFVKKGEKGIAILAPLKYKASPSPDDNNNTKNDSSGSSVKVAAEPLGEDRPKTVLRGFRVVHVFDISQTEGDELPDLDAVRPQLLSGDAPEGIWDALAAQANAAGYEVIRTTRGSANGYCDFLNKTIAVRPDVEPLQAVKTLVHELAHALLHGGDMKPSREIAEVEVESVAFIVCDALGLDTGDYSFAYVARWSDGDTGLITATGQRVVVCAGQILKGLEN